ncbi:putative telomere length regulation protein [Septoria linicola]|nr:putative telomere length regulation protein [Septoria linicola]
MADFLTAVKTTVKRNNDDNEPVLTAVSSRPVQRQNKPEPVEQSTGPSIQAIDEPEQHDAAAARAVSSAEDVLVLLRGQPSANEVTYVLRQLQTGDALPPGFSINALGPQQAQIINTLISTIIPDFWPSFDELDRKVLASCLCNVAGLNAIVARIRLQTDVLASKNRSKAISEELNCLLDVINRLLEKRSFACQIWLDLLKAVSDKTKQVLAWKDFITLTGSGKIVGITARAEDLLSDASDGPLKRSWISNASAYAIWLGENIVFLTVKPTDGVEALHNSDKAKAAAQLLARAFSFGYPVPLVKGALSYLVTSSMTSPSTVDGFQSMRSQLPSFAKRQLIESALQWLSQLYPSAEPLYAQAADTDTKAISAIAGAVGLIVRGDNSLQQYCISFMTDAALSSTISYSVRRAAVLTIASLAFDELQNMLESLLTTFGDQLFLNHSAIIQQESVAQTLLLVAGYLHRRSPVAVLVTARSAGHMTGTSNRLHSSNTRARWLGMIVATAISSLVDKEGSRMSFGTDDMQSAEAKWYRELVRVNDQMGSTTDFGTLLESQSQVVTKRRGQKKTQELPILNGKQTFGPPRPPVQTEVIGEKVTEILDDEEADDDDLKPYAKPDSDAEDSDEDATLVNRNKARAPVYIRDLMRMLHADKDHDKFQLAIKHAAPLIRRKANFGREVKDHAEELALTFSDLQDPFDTDDFDELRLQALIAVLLSDVEKLAPWLSRQLFSGDYSLSQRCIMLSALGLGGRELAGLKDQDELNPALANTSFPSKKLPAGLHGVYDPASTSVKRLESASSNVEHAIMRPLALSAADQTTSHLNAVKVKKFSSRMDVERTKRKPAANQLAKILTSHFFNPLVTRYQQDLAAYGQRSVFASTPVVQVTFIKTLALLLHASGPATMALAEVTSSLWDVLLALRTASLSDISILEAILFALLTLLEVNCEWGDKARLAQEEPKRLAETQSWIELVFERTGASVLVIEGSGEETRVRTLSAGVLVKCREIIEAYQKGLMGGLGPR